MSYFGSLFSFLTPVTYNVQNNIIVTNKEDLEELLKKMNVKVQITTGNNSNTSIANGSKIIEIENGVQKPQKKLIDDKNIIQICQKNLIDNKDIIKKNIKEFEKIVVDKKNESPLEVVNNTSIYFKYTNNKEVTFQQKQDFFKIYTYFFDLSTKFRLYINDKIILSKQTQKMLDYLKNEFLTSKMNIDTYISEIILKQYYISFIEKFVYNKENNMNEMLYYFLTCNIE